MNINIRELAQQYNDYIIDRRRYYHSCPELSGQEVHTAQSLKEDLEAAGLKLVTIEELQQLAESMTGVPKPIETGDKVVCMVEYRDGSVVDVIRQIKK